MDPLEKRSNIVKNLFHPTYTDTSRSSTSTSIVKDSRSTATTPHAALLTRESSTLGTAPTGTNEHDNEHDNENNTSINMNMNTNMNISTNADIGADDSFFQYPNGTNNDHAAKLILHDADDDDDDDEESLEQQPPPPQEESNEEEMEEALHSSMAVHTGHLDDLPPRTLPRNTTSTTTPAMPMSIPIPTPTPMKMKSKTQTKYPYQHQYNSKEEEALDLEARGLITPRKDLQSPPFVKRKMAMAMASELEHDLHVSSPPFRNFERGVPYQLNHDDDDDISGNGDIHNDDDDDDGGIDHNDHEHNDDDDETSSLISEYGSEVGQVKFRMEDIQAMEALTEGECEGEGEEEGEDDNDNYNNKERQDRPYSSNPAGAAVETNDSGISYESLKDFSERVRVHGSDCDSEVASSASTPSKDNGNANDNDSFNDDRARNDHNRRYRENEDELSQEDDGSVDSVDLSSHYGPISTEGIGQDHNGQDHNARTGINARKGESSQTMATNIPILTSASTANKTNTTATTTATTHSNAVRYSRRDVPSSPKVIKHQHREENEPTTPIGAMSAALRRLGNGVSNMTRCTKTPPQSSPHHYTFDDAPFQQHKHAQQQQGAKGQGHLHDDEEHNVWLSPRYGNSKNYVSKTSIQQPMFRSSPQNRNYRQGTGTRAFTNANAHTSNGITSCLSFDPESGRRPYGNMRMSDSPPSSPLPSHRKTRSWGSTGSDYFTGNVKDLFVGGGTTSTSGSGGIGIGPGHGGIGTGTGARHGPPYHGGHLSPKREGTVMLSMSPSPKARIRFVEDNLHSPKPSGNNRAIVLLQSPQRVGDIEREDALDLLALLVERSVAFKEKMDLPSFTEGMRTGSGDDDAPSLDFKGCIDALRHVSKEHNSSDGDGIVPYHGDRMTVLDQLEHSYAYAMEMKQAALSASTWLTAIGRTGTGETPRREQNYNGSQFISEEKMLQMDSNELRNLVKVAHSQLVEKNEINERLDSELSICRAEIGRLKTTSSRNETSFLSPDKSILDEEVDDDSSESSRGSSRNEFPDESEFHIEVHGTTSVAVEENKTEDTTSAGSIVDARKEILLLKAELEGANKMLKSMEQGIKWPKTHDFEYVEKTNKEASKTKIDDWGFRTSEEGPPSSTSQTGPSEDEDGSEGDCISVPVVPAFSDDSDNQMLANDETALKCLESKKLEKDTDQNTSIMMDGLRDELAAYVSAVRKADEEKISNLQKRVNQLERMREISTNPDDKLINVRMLNAENFDTEWDRLGPLPPPPDHDLRSPIVADLLTQWTSDSETRESLLYWVEKVVQGSDCADIPPLQLSGLDHQVRDGFTMHILPFLLRRSDIQVDVTSRAHRKTSYDLSVAITKAVSTQEGAITFGENGQKNTNATSAVSLKSKSPHMMAFKASSTNAPLDFSVDIPESNEKKRFLRYLPSSASSHETGSVAHSSATAPASNRLGHHSQFNRLVRDEEKPVVRTKDIESDECVTMAESTDRTPQQQGGIMAGALNAMGGLLSRRRTPSNADSSSTKTFSFPSPVLQSHASQAPDDSVVSDVQDESQPFHRVVSVPPGRIGMTFVQYRGHAMVSDVYKDSPLAGWVFPSDILIAIDEVPVSGMRVPEIVKLLTARKERPRALRIISSHAMTELLITESSNALMDG